MSSPKRDEQQQQQQQQPLPDNRFELELEFVQALASPAYLHFLATQRSEHDTTATTSSNNNNNNSSTAGGGGGPLLLDPAMHEFLCYLRTTWSQPAYARFLQYPHCLYFLDLLIEKPAVAKEWTQMAYRNFCHQQQFLAWQHRHAIIYGVGKQEIDPIISTTTTTTTIDQGEDEDGPMEDDAEG